MSSLPTSPMMDAPACGWAAVREEWAAEVERFIAEVETWTARRGWGTLQDPKEIVEGELGRYIVPRLLVHEIFGKTIFDPCYCFIVGADGLIDLSAMPSWDGNTLIRTDGAWELLKTDAEGERVPWSEAAFVGTIRELHGAQ